MLWPHTKTPLSSTSNHACSSAYLKELPTKRPIKTSSSQKILNQHNFLVLDFTSFLQKSKFKILILILRYKASASPLCLTQ